MQCLLNLYSALYRNSTIIGIEKFLLLLHYTRQECIKHKKAFTTHHRQVNKQKDYTELNMQPDTEFYKLYRV